LRVPVGLHQPVAVPDQRSGETVRSDVGLPAEQVLHIEATVVDPVDGPTADSDDPVAGYRDVHRIAVGVQDRRGLHPPIDLLIADAVGELAVNPCRPTFTGPYGVRAPRAQLSDHGIPSTRFTPANGWSIRKKTGGVPAGTPPG